MSGLPAGWALESLGELAEVNPKKSKPDFAAEDEVVFVPMAAVMEEYGGIDTSNRRSFESVSKGYTQFSTNDVLLAKITPCMENGKVAIIPTIEPSIGYGSTEFFVIRCQEDLQEWIAWFISQKAFRRDARANMQGAAGQLRVPRPWLESVEVPVAPLPEQRRIVAKIDELFSELDAGTQALKRAQAKLEKYRASVLKAAVEGRLAEQWRKDNPATETGQELLDRILAERRVRWEEEQLAKYAAKSKKPPKNWQAKYKEPAPPDTGELPGLPEGWCWGTVDQVFVNHDGRRVPLKRADRDERSGPYPYYGASGVIDDIDDYLFDGDYLLLAEDGANLVTRSKPIAFKASGKFWVNNHAHVLEPVSPLSIGYAEAFFNGLNLQFYVTGSAQPKLPQRTLNRIPIPIPGDREQQVIVERLGHALDGSLSTSGELTRALRLSKTVRQTILKRAFEGRLVPQDPSDEPASELLDRICSQRDPNDPKKKPKTKKIPQPELDL